VYSNWFKGWREWIDCNEAFAKQGRAENKSTSDDDFEKLEAMRRKKAIEYFSRKESKK